jgi:hypothetical protein
VTGNRLQINGNSCRETNIAWSIVSGCMLPVNGGGWKGICVAWRIVTEIGWRLTVMAGRRHDV